MVPRSRVVGQLLVHVTSDGRDTCSSNRHQYFLLAQTDYLCIVRLWLLTQVTFWLPFGSCVLDLAFLVHARSSCTVAEEVLCQIIAWVMMGSSRGLDSPVYEDLEPADSALVGVSSLPKASGIRILKSPRNRRRAVILFTAVLLVIAILGAAIIAPIMKPSKKKSTPGESSLPKWSGEAVGLWFSKIFQQHHPMKVWTTLQFYEKFEFWIRVWVMVWI